MSALSNSSVRIPTSGDSYHKRDLPSGRPARLQPPASQLAKGRRERGLGHRLPASRRLLFRSTRILVRPPPSTRLHIGRHARHALFANPALPRSSEVLPDQPACWVARLPMSFRRPCSSPFWSSAPATRGSLRRPARAHVKSKLEWGHGMTFRPVRTLATVSTTHRACDGEAS